MLILGCCALLLLLGVLSSLWNYYYLVAALVAVSLGGWYLLVRPRRNLGAA